ncbi:hypothetical protein MTO96_017010 [Rhipicephalus appendiculatus]
MAAQDHRHSETAEQWVLLEHDGGTGKDVLLQDQDGDEIDGKENNRKDVPGGGPKIRCHYPSPGAFARHGTTPTSAKPSGKTDVHTSSASPSPLMLCSFFWQR